MTGVQTVAVSAEEADLRLDRWFRRHFPALGHGRLEKLLRTGQVRVDGKRARANARLSAGQLIRVPPLDAESSPDQPARRMPPRKDKAWERDVEALRRAVLYRDADVLAINKPAGLAVQGGTGTHRHLDALLDGLRFDAAERPRLVHRLDKDTSGVLLLARNARAAAELTEAFRHKDVRKLYWAVVIGVPKLAQGRIDLGLSKQPGRAGERVAPDLDGQGDGKRAITFYRVVEHVGKEVAWLALMPLTGRTHQLRAHCAAIGTPILGDGKYGGAAAFLPGKALPSKLHLHARAIELPRPGGPGGRKTISVTAPLPPHMAETWQFFGFDADPGIEPLAEIDLA